MPSPAECIIDLYERHALAFDAARSRDLFERFWLDLFSDLLLPRAHILDLGCGMGEPIAHYLIDKGVAVTGIDSAPTMIDLCRSRFPAQEWIVADMRDLSLDRKFDGILAWDSFFHLTDADQRAMFGVFKRHAAAGAALMFTSGPAHGEAIGQFEGEPLYHASLDAMEYRTLLSDSDFAVVRHIAKDIACGGHTVWLAQRRSLTDTI